MIHIFRKRKVVNIKETVGVLNSGTVLLTLHFYALIAEYFFVFILKSRFIRKNNEQYSHIIIVISFLIIRSPVSVSESLSVTLDLLVAVPPGSLRWTVTATWPSVCQR